MANEIHFDTSLINYTGIKAITRNRLITPVGDIVITDAGGQQTMNWRFREIGINAAFGAMWELKDNAGNVVATAIKAQNVSFGCNLRVTGPGSGGDFGSTSNQINFTLDPTAFATGTLRLEAGGNSRSPSFGSMAQIGFGGLIEDAYTGGGRIIVELPLTCVAV